MLLNLCKSCQYCLETMYWNCCEERFCFDKTIATYRLEETDPNSIYHNGYANMGASLDSVITQQPSNNNHLPQNAITGREVSDLPFDAGVLYEVFSKSMIFRDDHELKSNKGSVDNLDEYETKSEPDYLSDKPNRTKVYFEDEVNSPVTDFEIMFKDELSVNNMFKIDEEEEATDNDSESHDGLVMNIKKQDIVEPSSITMKEEPKLTTFNIKKQDIVKPSSITMKEEPKLTTFNPIYEYDPKTAVPTLKTTLSLPRVESLKGILRQNRDLSRSMSAKTLTREDSIPRFNRPQISRVESMRNMDPERMDKVLSRVPNRSASYLNIPDHLKPEKPPLTKSKSTIGVVSLEDTEEHRLSRLADTPIIKSNNLPRFFDESPTVMEYKGETSLQSIQQKTIQEIQENDYSMPRYYGTVPGPVDAEPVHESKSMPDLRNPLASGKVSKRLVKIRSKLKPLVIKKGTDEML